MSATEYHRWRAFELQNGPLGADRGDWNSAVIAHVVASSWSKKGGRKPMDRFLPKNFLKYGAEINEEDRADVSDLLGDDEHLDTDDGR